MDVTNVFFNVRKKKKNTAHRKMNNIIDCVQYTLHKQRVDDNKIKIQCKTTP